MPKRRRSEPRVSFDVPEGHGAGEIEVLDFGDQPRKRRRSSPAPVRRSFEPGTSEKVWDVPEAQVETMDTIVEENEDAPQEMEQEATNDTDQEVPQETEQELAAGEMSPKTEQAAAKVEVEDGGEQATGAEPPAKVATQEEVLSKYRPILKASPIYRKNAVVYVRAGVVGERVDTVVGGELETSNTAKEGDFVVMNSTKEREQYILTAAKLAAKYVASEEPTPTDLPGGFRTYAPVSRMHVHDVTEEEAQQMPAFVASWGEEMIVHASDYLVMDPEGSEVYRIEREAFLSTYVVV